MTVTITLAQAEAEIARRQKAADLLATGPSFEVFAQKAWPIDGGVREGIAAVHEAGHAVACQVLGGHVREAIVSSAGVPGFPTSPSIGATFFRGELEGHIAPAITFAGIYTEARWLKGPRPDREALAAARRRNQSDDGKLFALTASGDVSYQDAGPILERCWPAVMTVAAQIFRTGSANETDVMTALGCNESDRTGTAHRLASIRAGLISM